jgi:hypothetical protein
MKPGIYRQKLTFESNFTTIPNAWIRNTGLPVNANFLLVYLLTHEIGYNITFNQIEREINLGETAIRTAMNQLKDAGWLETHRTVDDRGYNAGLAWILRQPDGSEFVVNPNLANPDLGNPDLDSQGTIENNLNKKTSIKEINTHLIDFEKFWNVYPRKTAKKAAFKVWSNLDADFDEVLAGALRYGNDPNLPPEIFIPHPATWLRNERWNDPMLPERVKTPEELKKIELEQIRVRREREKFLAEQERAERKRIEDDARAEPAPRCEHGRIIAACAKCIRAGKVG